MAREIEEIDAFRKAASHCPLPSAIELVGEKWAFLIIRGALNGLRHFEEFQACLGIARNILSDRLGKLVAGDVLTRAPDKSDRRKVIYSLTPKGAALVPVVLALRQWGLDWGHGDNKLIAADARDGKPVKPIAIYAQDGRRLALGDLMWIDPAGVEVGRALIPNMKEAG